MGYKELMQQQHQAQEPELQEPPVRHVTISNLQTIKFLDFDPEYKKALLQYKLKSLNKELSGFLKPAATDQSQAADADEAGEPAEPPS